MSDVVTAPTPLADAPPSESVVAPDPGPAPLVVSGVAPAPEVLTAMIIAATPDVAQVATSTGVRAVMPVTEYFADRRFQRGTKVPVIISNQGGREVASTGADAVVVGLIDGLVPEVREGRVVIMGVARQAGSRTKVAVATTEEGLDPVAACVGRAAGRVRALSAALSGERVDFIPWDPDQLTYARNALAPARVSRVVPGGIPDTVEAFTPKHQMAAAVGEGGLNSVLAGVLAGVAITVVADGA